MKWLTLYNKIGKQKIKITQNSDVEVIVDDKILKVTGIKFRVDGSFYLVVK